MVLTTSWWAGRLLPRLTPPPRPRPSLPTFRKLSSNKKRGPQAAPLRTRNQITLLLKLFKKLARRARDKYSARYAALAVFYTLHDAGDLAALGAIGALGG